MPFLAQIHIYPFKSLDGVRLSHCSISCGGTLQHDRMYALVDTQGKIVNGKRTPKVHCIRSCFSEKDQTLVLRVQGTYQEITFHIDEDRKALNTWFSDYFGFAVYLIENRVTGFPDAIKDPGPTVIGTQTLAEVASWFPGLDEHTMRLRLRTNLEIGDVPPFWEDKLFAHADTVVQFRIGDVLIEGANPCQRCVVPTRDPLTGIAFPLFQKTVALERKELLPAWSTKARFNHFYRLAVNTRIPVSESGKTLHVGDEIKIAGCRML